MHEVVRLHRRHVRDLKRGGGGAQVTDLLSVDASLSLFLSLSLSLSLAHTHTHTHTHTLSRLFPARRPRGDDSCDSRRSCSGSSRAAGRTHPVCVVVRKVLAQARTHLEGSHAVMRAARHRREPPGFGGLGRGPASITCPVASASSARLCAPSPPRSSGASEKPVTAASPADAPRRPFAGYSPPAAQARTPAVEGGHAGPYGAEGGTRRDIFVRIVPATGDGAYGGRHLRPDCNREGKVGEWAGGPSAVATSQAEMATPAPRLKRKSAAKSSAVTSAIVASWG